MFLCRCECGKEVIKRMDKLRLGYVSYFKFSNHTNEVNQGTHFLCLKVFASYEGVIEYLENFCFYYVKRDDEAYLSDSIIHLSINDGIFKYLGDKVEVEDYFYYKAMEFALEHFRKQNT
jgi:hypothetical protein